ncbi:uncharacterized protein PG986_004682 [Apiospora aurea]|uniref:Uncharacterized protein n=1 Tax=Apiospora aurea TaxID=335848 RepID=A0ABR1QNI9_9PEZI
MADHLVQKISAPLYPGKDNPDAKKKQAPLTYTYMLGHHVIDKLAARVGYWAGTDKDGKNITQYGDGRSSIGDSLGETARVLGINQTRLHEARNQTLWNHVAPTYLAAAVSSHNHLVMYLRDPRGAEGDVQHRAALLARQVRAHAALRPRPRQGSADAAGA